MVFSTSFNSQFLLKDGEERNCLVILPSFAKRFTCNMYSYGFMFLSLGLGIELFSKGLGDLYYPSNEIDPYLKDKDVSDTSSTCVCL